MTGKGNRNLEPKQLRLQLVDWVSAVYLLLLWESAKCLRKCLTRCRRAEPCDRFGYTQRSPFNKKTFSKGYKLEITKAKSVSRSYITSPYK